MQRVLWDIYEASLLIDAFWQIEKNTAPKAVVLQRLSDMLRNRAILKGISIDDTFRNYNGMKLQYGLLQYLITDGEEGLSGHISQTIEEVYNLYEDNYPEYCKILQHAKDECLS